MSNDHRKKHTMTRYFVIADILGKHINPLNLQFHSAQDTVDSLQQE